MKFTKFYIMFFVAAYMGFMVVLLISSMHLTRSVPVEDRQPYGNVKINGVKYWVPFRSQKTVITLTINSPFDFLFVSHTERDESFLTALLKVSLCIMVIIFIWKFDPSDPFNIGNLKLPSIIGLLLTVLILSDFIKAYYTLNFVTTLGDFKYRVAYDTGFYLVGLFTVGVIISMYIRAVKNHRELELTI